MVRFAHRLRALIIAALLLAGLGAVVIRLFFLQIVHHDFYVQKASQQHRFTLTLPPKRGKIVDRKGRDLALSVSTKSFYAVPYEIENPQKTSQQICRILNLKEKIIFERLKRKKSFVWIKRKVSEAEAQALQNAKLKGIYFLEESKRVYPGGKLLSHILGFTGIDDEGLEGLEMLFDRYLKGKSGWRLTEHDATGREIITTKRYEVQPVDGLNLVLTIDATIQTLAEAQLEGIMEKYSPKGATIVVMDPHTGDILAMANRPSYDLNEATHIPTDLRRNRAVTDFFEPGSTFKPFIAAAALEEKVVRLSDRFYCEEGSYAVAGHILHDVHPYGSLSVEDIVAKSSNIGMSKIGGRLGKEKIFQYVRKFGFGEKTGIDLPGEISGWVHPVSKWSKLTPFMISMGQEVTVTALQLTRGYCTLANGGSFVKPRIIREIVDEEGRVIFKPEDLGKDKVISEKTVQEIVQAMQGVVDEGTGSNAQIDGYSVAGKTGTAQKASPGGGYSHSKYVSSFIGFLPANDPRAVISVVVDEPQHFHYGGTVAAPAFKGLASALMRYMEVSPDRMYAQKTEEE